MRIDQVLPSLVGRDAIGAHTINIQRALHERGIESHIYFSTSTPDVTHLGHPIIEVTTPVPDRYVMYHASIGSPVFDTVIHLPDPIIVDYHNITPTRLIDRWEPAVGHELSLGRRQLAQLAPSCVLGLADSAYNERELVDLGYAPTSVAPLLIDMRQAHESPDPGLLERLLEAKAKADGPVFLYVGKISPHKAPHDLVAMLAAYRQLYGPGATLTIVGSPLGDRYLAALVDYIDALGLADAVTFAGSLSAAELEAHWAAADVFVTASDHEGFCVPLVEAMGHGLPVVAYATAAIPETVADAGLLLSSKKPIAFAAAVHRVVEDAALRSQLVAAGEARLDAYDLGAATEAFMEALLGGIDRLRSES
jgi:glycosyltransferase involved in cell wall biosynthesis